MAKRRMLTSDIIDSDAFMDMPLSSQALYVHFCMRADDDGFVSNPKKISRMIGAQEDDYKILLGKRFLLAFESGVCVVKHWKMHNYIQSDRYTQTAYVEELKMIVLKPNNSYTENTGNVIDAIHIKKERTKPQWQKNRQDTMKKSSLPYSFSYKMRQAFSGEDCPICFTKMIVDTNSVRNAPTIQHCKPVSLGGEHELDNIAIVCRSCNESTKDKETELLNNSQVIDIWNTIVGRLDTQVRLGKASLGKERLDKNTYGELGHVLLSEEEYTKLQNKFNPKVTEGLIFELDTYIASSNKKYASHYATLLNWAKRKNIYPAGTRVKDAFETPEDITDEERAKNIAKINELKAMHNF